MALATIKGGDFAGRQGAIGRLVARIAKTHGRRLTILFLGGKMDENQYCLLVPRVAAKSARVHRGGFRST